MAKLDFPDRDQSPWTNPDTGITYVWKGGTQGAWHIGSTGNTNIFVEKTGDKMTGDLTLGPEGDTNITLDATDGNAEFAGDVQMASQNGGPLAGFRNQIINGDFRIWQRGVSAYNNFGPEQKKYGSADRWYVGVQPGGDPGVLEQNPAAPQGFLYTGTWPRITTINHEIENFGQFAQGSTWTLSLYAGGVAPVCRVEATGTITELLPWGALENQTAADGSWFRYSATFTIPSDIRNPTTFPSIKVLVQNASENTMLITGIQLEPGPVATPFEHRPIGTELVLCQRYYQVLMEGGIKDPTAGLVKVGNTIAFPFHFLQEMRSAPSVPPPVITNLRKNDKSGDEDLTGADLVNIVDINNSSCLLTIQEPVPSVGTAGEAVYINSASSTVASQNIITASAEF